MDELYEKYVKVRKEINENNSSVRPTCDKYGISATYYYNQLRREGKHPNMNQEDTIFTKNESSTNTKNTKRGEGVEVKRILVNKVNFHAKSNKVSKKTACDDLGINYFRYRNAAYYVSCYDRGEPVKKVSKKSTKKSDRPKSIKFKVPDKEEILESQTELPKKVAPVENESPKTNKKVAVIVTDVDNLSDILKGL